MNYSEQIRKLLEPILKEKKVKEVQVEGRTVQFLVYEEDTITNTLEGIYILEEFPREKWGSIQEGKLQMSAVCIPILTIAWEENQILILENLQASSRIRKLQKHIAKTSLKFWKKLEAVLKEPGSKKNRDALFDRRDTIEDFYKLFRNTREFVYEKCKGESDETKRISFVDNYLLTLLTLWFLQEKDFFGDKKFFINLYQKYKEKKKNPELQGYKTFYELLNQLFESLSGQGNEPISKTSEFGSLTVLGPALFLNEEVRPKNTIQIPDDCFYNAEVNWDLLNLDPKRIQEKIPIFNLFDSRDWTEGNIDEYVLGAIYEKLITGRERKETGANYTPEEITEDISQNVIEPYLLEKISELDKKITIDSSKHRLSQWIEVADEKQLSLLFQLIRELKILDPAVGSAHFLESAINVLVNYYEKIWKRAHELNLKKGFEILTSDEGGNIERLSFLSIPLVEVEKFKLYLKFFIILSRNLYGVDINEGALKIARARLFLSLAKHFDKKEHRFIRFPNVNSNLRPGNSLIGYVRIEEPKEYVGKKVEKFTYDLFLFAEKERKTHVEYFKEHLKPVLSIVKKLSATLNLSRDLEGEIKELNQILQENTITFGDFRKAIITKSKLISIFIASLTTESAREMLGLIDSITEKFRVKLNEKFADEYFKGDTKSLALMRSFHWELEFPEVFQDKKSFDLILGNPPFLGGQKITGTLPAGKDQRDHIVTQVGFGKAGSADLCAYFFLRSFALLTANGRMGLVATNTISQGDTRDVGLSQILEKGGVIYRALPSAVWTGDAAVHYSIVCIKKGTVTEKPILITESLEEIQVEAIDSLLSVPGAISGNPHPLKENEGKSYIGSYVLGMGFVLEPEEAEKLIQKNPKNKDCIYPYLNGEDLNSRPDQTPSRYVIQFFDWPLNRKASGKWEETPMEKKQSRQTIDGEKLTPSTGFTFYKDPEEIPKSLSTKRRDWLRSGIVPSDYPYRVAADYPDLLAIIKEKVKPERDALKEKGNSTALDRAKKWWRYGRMSTALFKNINGMKEVICKPLNSPIFSFGFQNSSTIFSHALGVISLPDFCSFAIVQSSVHEKWAWDKGSTLGDTTLRYTPSDCFETFPFPRLTETTRKRLDKIGEEYYAFRKEIMLSNQEGLTKVYNRFHSPKPLPLPQNKDSSQEIERDIQRLRELHTQMDIAVRDAYGWSDLDLEHGFHETKQGLRFTISDRARREILDRLLTLNHERFAEEKS